MSRFTQPSDEPATGETMKARLKWFNVTKGFGFVSPADGSADAFLHVSVLHRAGLQQIGEGAELLCEIGSGQKGPQVINIIEILDAGKPAGPSRIQVQPFHAYDSAQPGGELQPRFVASAATGAELGGTVKWFKADKGFGFITADDSDKDVFIHKTVLQRSGLFVLEAGQRVQMRVHEAEKGREATWIIVS